MQRRGALESFVRRNSIRWAADKIERFEDFLRGGAPSNGGCAEASPRRGRAAPPSQSERIEMVSHCGRAAPAVVDIGCGRGFVSYLLQRMGYPVTAVDVADMTRIPEIVPRLYDGVVLPFAGDSFDVALLLTVLHHTRDPDAVIAEARRVASRLVVIEDTYHCRLKRRLTAIADSMANLEFRGHPHENRTDRLWRHSFARHGLEVRATRVDRVFGFFTQHTYLLERRT